jgi:hypothetical protein
MGKTLYLVLFDTPSPSAESDALPKIKKNYITGPAAEASNHAFRERLASHTSGVCVCGCVGVWVCV